MSYAMSYQEHAPSREFLDLQPGLVLLEFGSNWCGHCLRAQPLLAGPLRDAPGLQHYRVQDGPGRALGRSYRVKLWPTLILLRDGVEQGRLVRPTATEEVQRLLCPTAG